MSDPDSRGDLPTERDDPALTDDAPADLAAYDATPDPEDDVIDISDNSGPELTTGVADIDTGAAVSGGGRSTGAHGDDTGTATPNGALPDDEP
jgi:hypothetical protein